MLKSEKQMEICKKYSTRDLNGYVHCKDCPLVVGNQFAMCRANSHYDRKSKEWVFDDVAEVEITVEGT